MIWLLAVVCAVAFGYQLVALLASFRQLLRRYEIEFDERYLWD